MLSRVYVSHDFLYDIHILYYTLLVCSNVINFIFLLSIWALPCPLPVLALLEKSIGYCQVIYCCKLYVSCPSLFPVSQSIQPNFNSVILMVPSNFCIEVTHGNLVVALIFFPHFCQFFVKLLYFFVIVTCCRCMHLHHLKLVFVVNFQCKRCHSAALPFKFYYSFMFLLTKKLFPPTILFPPFV